MKMAIIGTYGQEEHTRSVLQEQFIFQRENLNYLMVCRALSVGRM